MVRRPGRRPRSIPGVSLAAVEQRCAKAGDFASLDGDTIKVVARRR